MDALTRVLDMARPRAGLDLRCQLSGAFRIDHAPAAPGIAPFHLLLAGRLRIRSADGELTAQADDFILFPRGGAHVVGDDGADGEPAPMRMRHDGLLPLRRIGKGPLDADLLCGHFEHVRGASELLFASLPDPLHVSLAGDDGSGSLRAVVALMRQEAAARRAGALAIVAALSQTLLALALRAHGERRDGESGLLALLADPRLGASAQAVLKDPGRDWSIETLGRLAAMSRAQYARRFRETAGMTVFEFVGRARMAIASDLLRGSRRTVADIAAHVGYQSEAAFAKTFRQRVGELPGQYRRRRRSETDAADNVVLQR